MRTSGEQHWASIASVLACAGDTCVSPYGEGDMLEFTPGPNRQHFRTDSDSRFPTSSLSYLRRVCCMDTHKLLLF